MIRKKAGSHFRALDLDDPAVSVVLTGDETIRELNSEWRDVDEATDVLSFPMEPPPGWEGPPPSLGDLIINLEYAERLVETRDHTARVADELGVPDDELEWSLADEVHFLFIHGLLHLLGHTHADPDDETEMKEAERRLWTAARDAADGNPG